jgi:GT2 family glycosyltransferase
MAGLEASERPVVLALNDDCIAPEGDMWLTTMLLALSKEDVGVVGAKLLYPDGRLQHSGILLDFHREDIGFHRYYGEGDRPGASILRSFPAVTGACLMCRREFFDMRADLYDSGNYEDVHLCLNAWEQGAKVMYQPAATLTHIEAVTKREIEDDYINHNRSVFVEQWRDKFLDSDAMRRARKVNVE